MRWLVVAVAATIASPAWADPAESPDQKSFLTSYFVTVASMTGPAALGLLIAGDHETGPRAAVGGMVATAGLILGPTAGHWYAGRTWTPGLTLRLASIAVIGGLAIREESEPLETETAVIGISSALVLWTAGFVWDAVTLPRSVRRANRTVVIAPTTNGVALAGTF